MENKDYKKQVRNHYILCGIIIVVGLIFMLCFTLGVKAKLQKTFEKEVTYIDTPIVTNVQMC